MKDSVTTKELEEEFLSSMGAIRWHNEPISEFERGVRQAAQVAKAAYMLRHNDAEVAQLLHEVIISPLVKP